MSKHVSESYFGIFFQVQIYFTIQYKHLINIIDVIAKRFDILPELSIIE